MQFYKPYELTEAAFNSDVPTLYHYTDHGGFTGMLKSKTLWFSNIRDQNDTQEIDHALDLINDVIEKEYPGLMKYGELPNRMPIYTCSMSAARDLLSQWRGYSHDGGYSYAIDKAQLLQMIIGYRLMLAKCLYEDEEKREFIRKHILMISPEGYKSVCNYLAQRKISHPNEQTIPGDPIFPSHPMHAKHRNTIRRNVATYAAILKHPAFKEEQEWRLITVPDYTSSPNTGGITPPSVQDIFPHRFSYETRESGGRTIEYVPMKLLREASRKNNVEIADSEVLLSEVIISPTMNKELARIECEKLVQHNANMIVSNSSIPYRK